MQEGLSDPPQVEQQPQRGPSSTVPPSQEAGAPPLLTDEEIDMLAMYYSTLHLSSDKRDRIADLWVQASQQEKQIICRVYCKLFSDSSFVQMVSVRLEESRRGGGGGAAALQVEQQQQEATHMRRGQRLRREELRRRRQLEEILPKLQGDGPFAIEFGLVSDDKDRREVLELYQSEFTRPDGPTIEKMIAMPRAHSTRTRKKFTGSHTWYIRSLHTQEIACCVTSNVHRMDEHTCYVEVPLFATRSGYKRNGLARLLNAALVQFCMDHVTHCKFLMVSADPNAVPFWTHLGYQSISRKDKNSIQLHYDQNCFHFEDCITMTVSIEDMLRHRESRLRSIATKDMEKDIDERCGGSHATMDNLLVLDVLATMPRFLLSGQPCLQAEGPSTARQGEAD